MQHLIKKYEQKLIDQGLCRPGVPLIGGLDADLMWNREDPACSVLESVINSLNINSILFARPVEPYFSIMNHLSEAALRADGAIHPEDVETRTFLHDMPVSKDFKAAAIIHALKRRKCIVVKDHGLVTYGTVSPEQAFIIFSSVCFCLFVKYFADFYYKRLEKKSKEPDRIIAQMHDDYKIFLEKAFDVPDLMQGPFSSSGDAIQAICETGQWIVEKRMVDSIFGNISYRLDNTVYVSQTATTLDDLAGCIDPCPMDNSSCTGITASTEYKAHKEIYLRTENRAVLHSHPKFSAIISMLCDDLSCKSRGRCHIECPKERFVLDIPVVPGESGTGPTGLSTTVPPAMPGRRGVIVYGHGIFTAGKNDFRDAVQHLLEIENVCFEEYYKRISTTGMFI
jgi:ribulose-5-phosphate 4-epimerase/fuculose-1-phosphate aldolase